MIKRSIHHVCIQTESYQESLSFYTEIMGFEIVNETAEFHGRAYNTWIKLEGFMIELQTPKKDDKLNEWSNKNAGIVHMCFMVDDVEKEFNRINSLGYDDFKVKNGEKLYKVEGNYLFKVKAPEGTEIEFRDIEI